MKTRKYGVLAALLFALLIGGALLANENESAGAYTAENLASVEHLTDKEFSSLIKSLSEDDPQTYTRTNNISNEASYLHIFPGALKLGVGQGVYIGVAPEQNFTYIAKFQPRMAFIVDIQRKNMLEVLMYKSLFKKAETPVEFLRLLLARRGDSIRELLKAPEGTHDTGMTQATLAYILKDIEATGVKLSASDRAKILEIYGEFAFKGGNIVSDTPPMQPTLRDLVFERDAKGRQENFLQSQDDYDFVRDMHRKNLIIPLVGNFGGEKTLRHLGKWLTGQNLQVSVFYVSSVEYHIRNSGTIWTNWLANFDSLPWEENGILIRTIPFKMNHADNPESRDGYEWMTLVQRAKGYTTTFAKPSDASDFARVYIPLRRR
jgi:hypothetical protein